MVPYINYRDFVLDNKSKNVELSSVMRLQFTFLALIYFFVFGCTLGPSNSEQKELERALISELATDTISQSRNNSNTSSNFRIGGNIAGLNGIVFLQNNAAEQAPFNISGRFFFPQSYPEGSNYIITVSSQPSGQTCTIANGFGKVSKVDVTDIIVNCLTN